MFELIAAIIALTVAGAGALFGHMWARKFVRRRLRYTDWVDKPGLGLAAGVVTAIVAAPIVAVVPVVGAGTALALGAGVGTGVHMGARESDRPLLED